MHVIRNYSDVFDVYYCKDEKFAKQFFNTKTMPKELPHIYIIDPKSQEPIKNSSDTYTKKYQNFIFNISSPQKELNEIIEKFMDEKLSMHYVTEDREQETRVKWLNSEIFEQEIIKNPDVK